MFSIAYASGASWNETHWSNAKFDRLLREARITLDEEKRQTMYHDLQALVRDDGGAIIPAFDNYIMMASDKLQYERLANNWNLDGYRLLERWWFG
jgi:peptide/nickel transport system substrate-binding protein